MVKIEDVEEEDDDLWLLDSARALEPQVKKKKLDEKEEDEDGCSLPGTFALGDRGNRLGTFLSWKDSLSACRYRCTGCEGDGKIFESKAEFAAHALLRHESQVGTNILLFSVVGKIDPHISIISIYCCYFYYLY